jgi:serine/threonine protein phosphatase 1
MGIETVDRRSFLDPNLDGVWVHASSAPPSSVFERLKRLIAGPRITPLPIGTRIYGVGDLHGRADLLKVTHAFIREEEKRAPVAETLIVYLGDYVDRGPDSKGVIDELLVPTSGAKRIFLRGNHDEALVRFLSEPDYYRTWKAFGGGATLMSYGVNPPLIESQANFTQLRDEFAQALPEAHRQFLAGLHLFARIGPYCFVHAGIQPGIPFEMQEKRDLLWVREPFLGSDLDHGMIIVHGHSPSAEPEWKSNRIGLDTGAYATGRLTVAVLEHALTRFVTVTSDGQVTESRTLWPEP